TDTELLYVRGIAPEATYQFKHALIRDAAYEALLKTRRRELHRRVADVLSQEFPDLAQEQPEILAHHYTEAGLLAEAVSHWLQAGKRMCQRSAHVEAIRHLTKGLGLLASMPEGRDRTQQELTLQMTLGTSLLATKGFGSPKAGQAYTRAHELCQRLGETPQRFPVLAALRSCYVAQGDLQAGPRVRETLLPPAPRTGDPCQVCEGPYTARRP